MGYEYLIRFDVTTVPRHELDALLRTIVGFEAADETSDVVSFRRTAPRDGMSDAWAALRSDGLYFCDNGADGADVLRDVEAALAARVGKVEVEEL